MYIYQVRSIIYICRLIIKRCKAVDNNKTDLRELGWGDMDRIDLVQDRDQWKALMNTVNEPPSSLNC
jgi:hypothetical protein